MTYDTAITVAESEADIRITTDTPYIAFAGELWGVYCEHFGENYRVITTPHCIFNGVLNDSTCLISHYWPRCLLTDSLAHSPTHWITDSLTYSYSCREISQIPWLFTRFVGDFWMTSRHLFDSHFTKSLKATGSEEANIFIKMSADDLAPLGRC